MNKKTTEWKWKDDGVGMERCQIENGKSMEWKDEGVTELEYDGAGWKMTG